MTRPGARRRAAAGGAWGSVGRAGRRPRGRRLPARPEDRPRARTSSNLYAVFLGAGGSWSAIVWVLATIAILRGRRRRHRRTGPDARERAHRGRSGRSSRWSRSLVLFGLTVQTLGNGGRQGHRRRQPARHGVPLAVAGRLRRRGRPASSAPSDQPLEVVLPVGQTVHVTLDSVDVIHSFYVPGVPVQARRDPGLADRVRPHRSARPASIRAPAPSSAASATHRCRSRSAASTQATFDAWLAEQRQARASVAVRERDRGRRRSRDRRPGPRPAPRRSFRPARVADHDRPQADRLLYITSAFGFAIVGGLLAEIIRLELAAPGRPAGRSPRPTTSCSRCTAR